jgi:hypothetical protein
LKASPLKDLPGITRQHSQQLAGKKTHQSGNKRKTHPRWIRKATRAFTRSHAIRVSRHLPKTVELSKIVRVFGCGAEKDEQAAKILARKRKRHENFRLEADAGSEAIPSVRDSPHQR